MILAGGVGERFWPASTPARPKQLLSLVSDRSMLRETADRLDGVVPPVNRFIITSAALAESCARECPDIPPEHVIGEPEAKNTAPAIGLMMGLLQARDPEAVAVVLPADHAIGDVAAFRASLAGALRLVAGRPLLALFGIVPTRPEAEYGYIERGEPIEAPVEAYEVAGFREKPSPAVARELWQGGRHTWNSGVFCGRTEVFLAEYGRHLPLMRRAIDAAVASWSQDPRAALRRYYDAVEATSIDYGVMQQTERAVVLPAAHWQWDDVGSWEALARWIGPTAEGNVTVGASYLEDCRDVIAFSESGRISALGLERCVIVRTDGETLVVARDALDRLKEFVRGATSEERGAR